MTAHLEHKSVKCAVVTFIFNETFCVQPQLASKIAAEVVTPCGPATMVVSWHEFEPDSTKLIKLECIVFLLFSGLWGHKSHRDIGELVCFVLNRATFVISQISWATTKNAVEERMVTPTRFPHRNLFEHLWYQFLSEWLTQWCWRSCNTGLGAPPRRGVTRQWRGGGARLLRPSVVTTTEAPYLSNK